MPTDRPAWAGSGEPAARRLQARIRGLSPVCQSVLFGSHSILEKKKKKISSKLSTFKTRESSPKKSDFHFLIIITKANISVSLTACGALPNGSRLSAPLTGRALCWDGSVLQASVLLLAAFCSWGSRGGGPGCSWWCVCPPGSHGPGLEVAWARALHSPQPRPLSVCGFLPCPGPGLGFIGLGPS